MLSNVKLSICCITYNHENFIAQAIDSFLSQKTSFPFEIVISDDKSTDNTLHIIQSYVTKHPDKIRLIPRKQNIGMNKNFFSTLSACRGEYIAICEGDDYWTDVNKLQKQVEVFDANPNLSLICHDVEIKNDVEYTQAYEPYLNVPNANDICNFSDVLFNHFIPTLSIVLRRASLPKEWPDFFYKVKSPDKALALSLMLKGDCYHLAESMGVYRHHDGGVTKKKIVASDWLEGELYLYNQFFLAFGLDAKRLLERRLAMAYYTASRLAFSERSYSDSLRFLVHSISKSPLFLFGYFLKKYKIKF